MPLRPEPSSSYSSTQRDRAHPLRVRSPIRRIAEGRDYPEATQGSSTLRHVDEGARVGTIHYREQDPAHIAAIRRASSSDHVEEISNQPQVEDSASSTQQLCEVCDREESDDCKVWICVYCNNSFICDNCWNIQLPHKRGKNADQGALHEKADPRVIDRLQRTLNPHSTHEQREGQHRDDEDTTWFGIQRGEDDCPMLYEFGRFSNILADAKSYATGYRYPQLVSFIGQTGAGKSTLVRMLIEKQESEHIGTGPARKRFPSPVVGHIVNEHTPTSGDVHLYADPTTYFTTKPMVYADCEGLQGGEKIPVGAMYREADRRENQRLESESDRASASHTGRRVSESSATDQQAKRLSRRTKRNETRRLEWAIDPETKKRGYAVAELYPRLLYTFSDTVVFVIRNVRAFEATLLDKIIDWAHASLETSIGQPALPHAIVVLNATDLRVDPQEWDDATATETLMSSVADAVDQNHRFHQLAAFWRQKGYTINTTHDLLLRYYMSIRVVRVPAQGRYMLLNEQIGKLHSMITKACNESYQWKRMTRMLFTIDELNIYLQAAFDHFSQHLDKPFNFIEIALQANPIPFDFGGNILNLVRSLSRLYPEKDGPWLFSSISAMVASCIILDRTRRKLRGTLDQLLKDEYLDFCDLALSDFCELFSPCSYVNRGERCVVNKSLHKSKGHQNIRGKILGNGSFESSFNYEEFIGPWLNMITEDVLSVNKIIDEELVADQRVDEEKIATDYHLEQLTVFYEKYGGALSYKSNTVCYACMRVSPRHPLPCGHVLCTSCIHAYACKKTPTYVSMRECPLHIREARWESYCNIPQKPPLAGVRVLCLDGGGIRGVVELEVLRALGSALPHDIPIRAFFDLMVGTSTGGIVALGLGCEHWPIDECLTRFINLSIKAFTPHKTRHLALLHHGGRYKTTHLQDALRNAFSGHSLFGGSFFWARLSGDHPVKVAVTSTTETWEQALVLTNYNREFDTDKESTYRFERPEEPSKELAIWEVARATSAAPSYFKPFVNPRTKQGYLDGAIYHNNPVDVANDERKLIWPEEAGHHPDLMLSIGTGRDGEADKQLNARLTHMRPWVGEPAPLPEKRTKPTSTLSSIPRLGSFLQGMQKRFDSVLDAEETWHKFIKQVAADPAFVDYHRYKRVNPNLGFKVPKLDDKNKVIDVQREVRSEMEQSLKNPESELWTIAHRLVASSFYFELIEKHKSFVTGVVRCRFEENSKDVRSLGDWLMACQSNTFQPHFKYEKVQDMPWSQIEISRDVIRNMRERATFEGPRITLRISRPSAPSVIEIRFAEVGMDHPISGFPRRLILDEDLNPSMKRYNTLDAKDSNPRLARARQRRGARASHAATGSTDIHSIVGSPRVVTSPRIPPSSVRRTSDHDRPSHSTPELSGRSPETQSLESMSPASEAYPPPPTRPPPRPFPSAGSGSTASSTL